MATRNDYKGTFRSVHPGEVLKLELKERGISQKEFAMQIQIQKSHLSEIINGKRNMPISVASAIERELGIKAEFWLNMQNNFACNENRLANMKAEEYQAHMEIDAYNNIFDVDTVIARLWDKSASYVSKRDFLVEELCLPAASVMQADADGLFRRSTSTGTDERMTLTWIFIAKYLSREIEVEGKYDACRNEEMFASIRDVLNRNENTVSRLREVFSKYGVKFGVVDKVKNASIDAYSFVKDGVPAIMVTMRYNKIDNLAFSIAHELGHIALCHYGQKGNCLLDIGQYVNNTMEREADNFASDLLIPKSLWKTAPEVHMNPILIQRAYTRWADSNHINKWIALGRISHATGMYKFKSDDSRRVH